MKIVFLSLYAGQVNRGAETFVLALSSGLTRLGYQVHIRKNIFDSVPADARIIIGVNGGWDNLFSRIWCWMHQAKLVVSGQSGLGKDDKINLLLFPDVFVSLTGYQNRWANKFNPWVKTRVIPNGVDPVVFHPRVKPFPIELPRPVVLNVGALGAGNLQPDKGQLALIKAAARLKDVSVLLCGQGKDRSFIESEGQKLLGKRFKIISVPHQQMPGVYSAADLFAYPTSPWESFGISLLEAMACGLPVVVGDDPIRREIVGGAGLFCHPADTAAFASAIRNALTADWGNKPRLQAQKYSWSKIVLDYDALFKTLCSQ